MSDGIRELFHREAAAIEPARPDPTAVTSAGRRRLRRRRASIASLSLVVAAAVSIAGVQLTRRGGPSPAAGEGLSVVARVRLASSWSTQARGVGDLAYGFGRVWVISGAGPTLQRIDPATNGVDDVVPLGSGDDGVFWHVEAGFGRLWLTSPRRDGVLVVDPESGDVTGRVEDVPGGTDVLATGDHLWVHGGAKDGSHEAVHRIDPETLEVVGSVPMGSECCVAAMVEHGGYLWVAHSDVADSPRDPAADHDDAEFDLTNELRKVDPETLSVVETIALPGDTYRPGDTVLGDLTAAAGHLWVSRPDARAVDRVDPQTGSVESVELGENMRPDGLSHFEGLMWAWEINRSRVVPIDPVALEAGRTSDLGANVSGVPVEGAGSLWAAVQPEGSPEHVLRVGPAGAPQQTAAPPPEPTLPPGGDLVETVDEQTQAEIFAFRALAYTGLMHPFSARTYNFTYEDDTTPVDGGWRIGFAASDCEPKDGTFTCTGLSGEDPKLGNALTDTYVTVELDDGRWTVTAVDGNMPERDRGRLVGYTLPQQREPSHWEFPATGVWRRGRSVMAEMLPVWVGPYPTEAPGSVCEAKLLDASGDPVGDPQRFYQEPPNRPFERAGWVRLIEGPSEGDPQRLVVECYQRGAAP